MQILSIKKKMIWASEDVIRESAAICGITPTKAHMQN